jgi:hypothetical protein
LHRLKIDWKNHRIETLAVASTKNRLEKSSHRDPKSCID